MLKGDGTEIAVTIGTVITVVIVLGILGLVGGALVQVQNELKSARQDLAAVDMAHVVLRCLLDQSGGKAVTVEVLEKAKNIEKFCQFRGVTAEVEVIGSKKTFGLGGGGDTTIFTPVMLDDGKVGIGVVRVDVDV